MLRAGGAKLSELWRRRLAGFVLWFAIGLGLHLMQSPLYWHAFLIDMLILLVHFVWGVGQAIRTAALGLRSEDDGDVALLSLANLAALTFFALAPLWHWGDRLIFSVVYDGGFDAVVRRVQAGGPLSGEAGSFFYQATKDRQFVVFFWLEGIPDGGTAIVYDPENRLTAEPALTGQLEADILDVVAESPIRCWDFTGPYSKCHYD